MAGMNNLFVFFVVVTGPLEVAGMGFPLLVADHVCVSSKCWDKLIK